ncbi:carbohydrate ABC transporter permease [Streptomyces sp. NBC_01003]|uniref:carbohydrate ABC transporter permease n=1 Tax=Streptomyces sp. NBC_01003 TaxID=2903714 RepID=UPI003866FBC3
MTLFTAPGRRSTKGSTGRSRPTHNLLLHYVICGLIALVMLLPLVFMFAGALKPNAVVLADGGSWRALIPLHPTLDNFTSAWERSNFGRLLLNSLVVCGATVGLGLVVNSMFGYALARLRWTGRNVVLAAVVALIIIPFEALAIPLLLMMTELGWLDTYQAQIVPFIANPFFIYLFCSFFLALPRELGCAGGRSRALADLPQHHRAAVEARVRVGGAGAGDRAGERAVPRPTGTGLRHCRRPVALLAAAR